MRFKTGVEWKEDLPEEEAYQVFDTILKDHPGSAEALVAAARARRALARAITLIDPHGNFGTLDDPPAAKSPLSAPAFRQVIVGASARTQMMSDSKLVTRKVVLGLATYARTVIG